MGLVSLIAPHHNVAATMRGNIAKLSEEVTGALSHFDARSRSVHVNNGVVVAGAGSIPLNDPAVEGVIKLLNSKSFDKVLGPRRLRDAVTPSAVRDARAAVSTARDSLAMTKEQRKNAGAYTINSLDMQAVLQNVENSLQKAHFSLSSPAVEKEIRAAAPVRKIATATRVGVIGGAAATGAIIAIPGAKDTVQAQATDLYKQFAP